MDFLFGYTEIDKLFNCDTNEQAITKLCAFIQTCKLKFDSSLIAPAVNTKVHRSTRKQTVCRRVKKGYIICSY